MIVLEWIANHTGDMMTAALVLELVWLMMTVAGSTPRPKRKRRGTWTQDEARHAGAGDGTLDRKSG
jgi:hypothetical protein